MKTKLKLFVLLALSLVGVFAATTSANACWLWAYHQRECPKSLIKVD